VGFPIRKYPDQSLFAAPQILSQRTTSFIASQRQGIHRILLRHLIALIIDAHRSAADRTFNRAEECSQASRKDHLLPTHPGTLRSSKRPQLASLVRGNSGRGDRMCFLFTMSDTPQDCCAAKRNFVVRTIRTSRGAKSPVITCKLTPSAHQRRRWWSQTGSNRRPHACKARALPTELWPLIKAVGSGQSAMKSR
jgi:hypothetical protein